MDVTNEFEADYTENAHRLEITIEPTAESEIHVEQSKLEYGQTVVWLGNVTDKIRDIPGVESAYPRGDQLYFTVAKENHDVFSRILDNVFAVIETELTDAMDRTRRRLEELSNHTVLQQDERDSDR